MGYGNQTPKSGPKGPQGRSSYPKNSVSEVNKTRSQTNPPNRTPRMTAAGVCYHTHWVSYPPPPCISSAVVQATVGVGTVIILYVI